MKTLAEQIHAEADSMRIRSQRQMQIYAVVGIILVLYLAWAFHRIATFIEPTALAETAGEIVAGKATEVIGAIEETGKKEAPTLVHEAEAAVVQAVPDFRLELETNLRTQIGQYVKVALAESDKVMVDELSKIPTVEARLMQASKDPEAASKLFTEVRAKMMTRQDLKDSLAEAMAGLNKVRDHLRKLKTNAGLTPLERAERRLLQVVMTKFEVPKGAPGAVVAEAKSDKKKHH